MEKKSRSKAACDRCRSRRSKCTGTQPCQACAKIGHECNYSETRRKTIVLESKLKTLEYKAQQYDLLQSMVASEGESTNVDIPLKEALRLVDVSLINLALPLNPSLVRESVQHFATTGQFSPNAFTPLVLCVLALGQFHDAAQPSRDPASVPGLRLFKQAWQHYNHLELHSVQHIEFVLCCSYFFRCLGDNQTAVDYSAFALEMCVSKNLHVQGDNGNEYSNAVFWATYTVNRFFSMKLARPLWLNRDELRCKFPDFSLYGELRLEFSHLQSCVLVGTLAEEVNETVYLGDNRDSIRILEMLQRLVTWKKTMPADAGLKALQNMSDVKQRFVSSIYLMYCLTIQLATVPLLAKILDPQYHRSILSGPLQSIIANCFNSATLSMDIATHLHNTSKLSVYGANDNDYLYYDTLVLCIYLALGEDDPAMIEKHIQFSLDVFAEFSQRGNARAVERYAYLTDIYAKLKVKQKGGSYFMQQSQKSKQFANPDSAFESSFMTTPQSFNFFSEQDMQFWKDSYLSVGKVRGEIMLQKALESYVS